MGIWTETMRKRLERLSSTNVSDAMDALGIQGATRGIRPMMERWDNIAGPAVTMKLVPAGSVPQKTHLGVHAIEAARSGDVIVVDNAGRMDSSCWGGILANGAKYKGISGVVIDGCCRDLDDCVEADFPVFARGTVVCTARGRIVEESTQEPVQFGGVTVRPGDIILGDRSGIVVIPQERMEEVLCKAEELYDKEENMIANLKSGMSMLEVDEKYNYNAMLHGGN